MKNTPQYSNNNFPQSIRSSTDKRPFYVWIAVLLGNIGMILSFLQMSGFDLNYFQQEPLGGVIILGILLFVSIIPVMISKSSSRLKNLFGYGIPVLLLLPLIYFVYDYYTCTGKFCEILPFILGWAFCLSAIIFAIFYTIGIFARKYSVKFILSVIWIEIILLVGSALYFGFPILN